MGAAAAAGGSVIATPISSDPYTHRTSQHRTQVEPDSFGYGDTVLAAFQTGCFNAGVGASNIAWATTDGGSTWSQPRTVAGPFKLAWIAQTDQGPMVGDFISTSFAGGPLAFPVFAITKPPENGTFNERAAAAKFDVTAPQMGKPLPVRSDPVRYRGRSRLHLLTTR